MFDMRGAQKAQPFGHPLDGMVCAQHGRELMGCKSASPLYLVRILCVAREGAYRTLHEPPTADPHGGWCGGWRLEASGYPIRPTHPGTREGPRSYVFDSLHLGL